MEASRVMCTNCVVIVVPKTFKELISIVLEVRSIVVMICRFECFIGGSYNTIISSKCYQTNFCNTSSLDSAHSFSLVRGCPNMAGAHDIVET